MPAAEAVAAPRGTGVRGDGPEKHPGGFTDPTPYWPLTVEELIGSPVNKAQVGYDPCTYPDDPRLVGKAKKEPQPPESVPMDCEAEWERISAEQAWPDDLGYTI
jgi:hypothetical protein